MTTVATRDDAARIAGALVIAKLAACVQVLPMESYYTWRNAIAHENEFLLLIKTRTALVDDLLHAIEAAHPYETPEIVFTEFKEGSADYFSWIESVTKSG